jgi:hypothetical protein
MSVFHEGILKGTNKHAAYLRHVAPCGQRTKVYKSEGNALESSGADQALVPSAFERLQMMRPKTSAAQLQLGELSVRGR